MAGYIWHNLHAFYVFENLSEATKIQMPHDSLRKLILGSIVPDLAGWDEKANRNNKELTHYNIPHPDYGKDYLIPNLDQIEKIFMRKDPTYLGILSHLYYDCDHINNFLLIYAKPIGNGRYENMKNPGETFEATQLWGDKSKSIYGELYKLYDKFNAEMAIRFTPLLNQVFETDFAATKDGYLDFIKWLFPGEMPLSGVPEMDEYRTRSDIHEILKRFFDNDGKDCKITAEVDDLVKIVKESAKQLAEKINQLYAG